MSAANRGGYYIDDAGYYELSIAIGLTACAAALALVLVSEDAPLTGIALAAALTKFGAEPIVQKSRIESERRLAELRRRYGVAMVNGRLQS